MLGDDTERVTNYRNTTNYLNVIASKYETITERTEGVQRISFYQNYEKLNGNLDNTWGNTRQYLLILQIDPYNYNINTETNIGLTFNVDEYINQYNDVVIPEELYIVSKIYTTTQNWSQYLDRTITTFSTRKILEAIEDVDNNFLYTKTSNIERITQNTGVLNYNIPFSPNETNYIAINIIPTVKASYYDGQTQTWGDYGSTTDTVPLITLNTSLGTMTLTGTNIIPDGTYEVIDIPGLMWQILTMPFAFVSQAFNLTLFPGTPYQLNISNLFLSIVAILVFVWLISFIIKIKG